MLTKFLVTLIVAFAMASSVWAQHCRTDVITASTPSERFALNDNGTVTDKNTGLTWMRCALGQTWDGERCLGKAKMYTWDNAMKALNVTREKGVAGHNDWQLPQIPELASIIERQCFNPRVNTAVFPETPSVPFWSATERKGSAEHAYVLSFGNGGATSYSKRDEGAVRLMRGGPWWKPPMISKN